MRIASKIALMMEKRMGIDVIEMVVVEVAGDVVRHGIVVPVTVPTPTRRPVIVFVVPKGVEMDRRAMIDRSRPAMSVPPMAVPMPPAAMEVASAAVPVQSKSMICGLNPRGAPACGEQYGQT
jgi:hypothetical protein